MMTKTTIKANEMDSVLTLKSKLQKTAQEFIECS
jgi:hypothetical protein